MSPEPSLLLIPGPDPHPDGRRDPPPRDCSFRKLAGPGPEPVCRPFALDVEGRIPAAFQDEVRLVTSGTVRRATGLLTQEMVPRRKWYRTPFRA